MACTCLLPSSSPPPRLTSCPSSLRRRVCQRQATGAEGVTEEPSLTVSSARTQLELLEQLTSDGNSSGSGNDPAAIIMSGGSYAGRTTIREQLQELVGNRQGEFELPLGKKSLSSWNSLTVSQKRNIKRQALLNEVGGRNDSVFFGTVAAFILIPPLVILSIAFLTGYVNLLP